MPTLPRMNAFGVLADDLTGSCDTGVPFSSRGSRVLVLTRPDSNPPVDGAWQGVVLNTETRHAEPEAAARCVEGAMRRLAAAGWPLRYKKIDSTLRGPLVAELRSLLASGLTVVVAPSFPEAGRTLQDGVLHVDGRPVHATEFGRDRHNPSLQSYLPALLEPLAVPQARLALADLERGDEVAAEHLAALLGGGARLILADATRTEHLGALAAAVQTVWTSAGGAPLVAVGSAGLAAALALRMLPESREAVPAPGGPRQGPVLVIAGSQSEATRRQRDFLLGAPGVHTLVVQPDRVDADDWETLTRTWLAECHAALGEAARAGAGALVVHVAEDAAMHSPQLESERYRWRSQRLNPALGELAATLAAELTLCGLVLTGGDTATAVLQALECGALQLGPQVLPGMAVSWAVDGRLPDLPVVTKAGGFGGADALSRAVNFLQQHGARS